MRRALIRLAVLALACFVLNSTLSAYYFFAYYNTSTGPFNQPVLAKFNLDALVNNTVPFFISDSGPAVMAPGDSFQAMIGEIRGAAAVWSNVSSSKLKLAYGGLFASGSASELSPGIDVEFSDDIPPGLVAIGTPQVSGALGYGGGSLIVPITRAKIYLPNDMTQVPTYGNLASYSEPFFVTMVHEFGHTLGLQHTLTSSVMSTLWTSASSKALPLGADDIAGISVLYPADGYLDTVGSISGRVTLGSKGLSLASVVALSASNPAISILTNPDGSYRMDGVPPGLYKVYTHPLPPALFGESSPDNIVYPTDVNGNPIGLNYSAFGTEFFTADHAGTRNSDLGYTISVLPGLLTSGVDFQVSGRNAQAIYAVRTYGFSSTNVAEASPPLRNHATAPYPVAASGSGLLQKDNTVTPGLSVSVMGNSVTASNLRPYPPPTPYIAVDLQVNVAAGEGPKHLLFYTPNDLYVLPAAFSVVGQAPPSITSVAPALDDDGHRVVLVRGTGFFPSKITTSILFDGLEGVVQAINKDGSLLVTPPPASGKYTATVVAVNSDGQSSLFLNPNPPTYTYDAGGTASLTVTPQVLVAGSDTTVDIVGANTNFLDDQTLVGFGTSDVLVKQVTVLSPTHLTVTVHPNVTVATKGVNVTTGLAVVSQALGNKVTTAAPKH